MTLIEFRESKDLHKAKQKLWEDKTFQLLIGVMEGSHSMLERITSTGVSPDDKMLRLGQIEGYNKALIILKSAFQEPTPKTNEIRSTFEPPQPI